MLQNIPKEKILDIVRQGPTIPNKIVKIVGGDTMLIGAILSTLISTGEVKYSTLKIGGSPLYYLPEHEQKLEEYLSYLNEKDQKTVKTLKDQKIIHEATQDPLTRVSLKAIRDFARPITVDTQLFYRYFLVPPDEAEILAQELLKKMQKPIEEIKVEEIKVAQVIAMPVRAPEQTSENEEPSTEDADEGLAEQNIPKEKKKESKKEDASERIEKIKKEDFLELIKTHVHKMNLDIINKDKIKKTEYSLILKNHDSNEYIYCVAKDKKTINEGDLSIAFVFAHNKKMSCIFLTTGTLTKKAEAMTHKEFKDMKIEKIEG